VNKAFGSILILAAMTAILVAAPALAEEGEHAYIGSSKCKKCHLKQYKSWEQTAMATAFDALKPGERAEAKTAAGLDPEMDYTANADCVGCHVTGYGKAGGFVDIGSTPELVGVGCESCHGPGGTYTQDHLMSLKNKEYKKADVVAAGLVAEVSAEQCVVCHNENATGAEPGYVFDFEANKDTGTHEHIPLKYSHE